MSGEIQLDHGFSGDTLYLLIFDAGGHIAKDDLTVEPIDMSHWSHYAFPGAEAAGTGIYIFDFPALAAGRYGYSIREQFGGSPDAGDAMVGVGELNWGGAAPTFPDPGTPAQPNLCRVYGYEYQDGEPVGGRSVLSKLSSVPQTTASVILEGETREGTSDDTGLWHLDLVQGKTYQINIPEAGILRNFLIPAQPSVDLRTLL